MWNSLPVLNAIAAWGIWIGALAGGVAVAASLVGGLAAHRASAIESRLAKVEIGAAKLRAEEAKAEAAKADARAEEAKAEAAKAHERLKKSQEARNLTTEQLGVLEQLFKSDVFQKPNSKLRVSSVEDAEARMFAMQFQNLMQSCGVNIYPTDGGFPSTCVQLTPNAAPLTLTVKSGDVTPDMQHLVAFERTMLALGFEMPIAYDERLAPGEGVLYVMRKAAV